MNDTDLPGFEPLAPTLYEIAVAAGRVILQKRNQCLHIRGKQDGSPSTAADHASEELICSALATLTPDIPVIAEERVSLGTAPPVGDRPFWLVDPLDGTRDYIAGEPDFTVNIALVQGAVPVLGVIHAPALEESFIGAKGMGATRIRQGRAGDMACRPPPADGLTVLTSRHHGDETELAAWLAQIPVRARRRLSSAYKFGLLACGEADLYPRFGRVMGWDVAAGHAIVNAAGGRLTTPDGQMLDYRVPDYTICHFVARGRLDS